MLITANAIRTRYYGPTNYRGARIIATSDDGQRLTFKLGCHPGNAQEQHRDAAQAWLDKFNPYGAKVTEPGAGFGGDYYWTWHFVHEDGQTDRIKGGN